MLVSPGESEPIGSIGGYVLVDRLGSGGMGVVYLGHSPSGRQVAVKVIHAQYAQDEEFRARFRQEVAAARRVSGAFTAPVVDADPDAGLPWMATLYVPGRTLSDTVAAGGPIVGSALRTLALGLVEALRDIHRAGVVHRDLKPGNVLMAGDGPRVIDFGISRAADNQALTVTGRLMGTPPFMSPEQFASPRDVTAGSDVFSLGSLLAYSATGTAPFEGESAYMTGYRVVNEPPLLDGLPQPLRGIVERCLEKDATARPELAELHRLFEALPDTAFAPGPPAVPDSRPRPAPGTGTSSSSFPSPPPPPSPPPALAPAPARSADARTMTAHHGSPQGRRDATAAPGSGGRGRRSLIALAAALAVTAVGVWGFHLMSHTQNTKGSPSASAPAPALPAHWHPWRTDLTRAVKDESPAVNVDTVESGCVVAGSSLYCAGTGFTVARISAATGHVEWRFGSTSQAAERPLGVRNGLVYVYVQPHEDSVYSTQQVVALDAGTGKRVWTRTIDAGHRAVLFKGGVLAMSGDATEFVALSPATGRDLWRTPAKSTAGTGCSPVSMGGAPYGVCTDADAPFKGSAGFLRLDPGDGTARELGALPLTAHPLGAVAGHPLFALQQRLEGESDDGRDEPYKALLRVDPATGAVSRVALKNPPRGTPTLVDGAVYFVRPDGTVTALRASDGRRLWQRATETENLSAPVLSTTYDSVYFANRYGRLLALDRETGATRWKTGKLADPGTTAEKRLPSVRLVKDAIVAVAGDVAFSVRPDHPAARAASAPAAD